MWSIKKSRYADIPTYSHRLMITIYNIISHTHLFQPQYRVIWVQEQDWERVYFFITSLHCSTADLNQVMIGLSTDYSLYQARVLAPSLVPQSQAWIQAWVFAEYYGWFNQRLPGIHTPYMGSCFCTLSASASSSHPTLGRFLLKIF